MLRHIVMWKFRPGTEAERDLFLTGLQGLYGVISELKSCRSSGAWRAAIMTPCSFQEFENREAAGALQKRPPAQGGLRAVQIHSDGPGGGGLSAAGLR